MGVRFKKRRLFSPVAVSLLHWSILLSLWFCDEHLRNIRSVIFWTFWPIAVVCLLCYYECCLIDPGFQSVCVSTYVLDGASDRVRSVVERAEKEEIERSEAIKKGSYRDPTDDLIDKVAEKVKKKRSGSSSSEEGASSEQSKTARDHEATVVEEDHVVIDFASEDTEIGPMNTSNESLTERAGVPGARCTLEVTNSPPTRSSREAMNFKGKNAFAIKRRLANVFYAIVYALLSVWQLLVLFVRALLVPFTGVIKPSRPSDVTSSTSVASILKLGVSTIYQDGEKLWFCTKCRIFRPLRAKHCNDCGYCVRVYDHHCPWIGCCVGERNHGWFYMFLFYQTVELIYATVLAIYATIVYSDKWLEIPNPTASLVLPHVYLMFMILVMMSLGLVTLSLLGFQTILLSANMSTWELTCWDRISYLKTKCRKRGSPFGASTVRDNVTLALQIPNPLSAWCRPRPHQMMKLSALDKFVVGPQEEQFWRIKTSDGADYGPPPPSLANKCCNLFELCA